MQQSRAVEIGVGVFVALGVAALFLLAMKVSNLASFSDSNGYDVNAHFTNIGGLKERAPVTMAGVRIGRVKTIEFDPKNYEAKVTLRIDGRYTNLPTDSNAQIFTAGLLGEKYIALEAGGAEQNLRQGDEIKITQSAIIVEQMIGKFLLNKAENGGMEKGALP